MKHNFTIREVASAYQRGVNYGADMNIIARSPKYVLWQKPGHGYWGGIGQPQAYAPAELALLRREDLISRTLKEGRTSAATINEPEILAKLEAAFGKAMIEHIVAAIKNKSTLLIDGGGEQLRPTMRPPRVSRDKDAPPRKSAARLISDSIVEKNAYTKALQQIADGHNDPRSLAREILAKYKA